MKRYVGAAGAALMTYVTGTGLTVLFGHAWNDFLVPGVFSSAVLGGYFLWATRARDTPSPPPES